MCLYRVPGAAVAMALQGSSDTPPPPEPTVLDLPDRTAETPPAREAAA
ncbi:hypothetical protein [Saccharothrix sp.]|nr:hypothetical protein [Saccharothrix sp.]